MVTAQHTAERCVERKLHTKQDPIPYPLGAQGIEGMGWFSPRKMGAGSQPRLRSKLEGQVSAGWGGWCEQEPLVTKAGV